MSDKLLSLVPATLVLVSLLAVAGAGQSRPVSATRTVPGFQDPTASVSGTVVNSLNEPVSAASIIVTNNEQGLERRTRTSDQGYFYVPFLPPGSYTVLIEMAGFATIRISGVELQSSINSALSLTLVPRGAKEVVEIKATTSDLDASSATVKFSVSNKQIEALPIIASSSGRTILDSIPLFLPGVSPTFSVGIRGEGLVVNGARPLANSFSIEGGDNNDYGLNRAASPFPNPDALQAVTVQTSNYKADVGGSGAIFDATVKAGTNRFHGNLRYLLLPPALSARGFFDEAGPSYATTSFGGQIGGPLVLPGIYDGRDRTHFFFDVERNYVADGYDHIGLTVPVAERSGDFSALPLSDDPLDPNSERRPIDPRTGRRFPGDVIPPERVDPIAKYYLQNLIPLPDIGPDTYRVHSQSGTWTTQYTMRIDQAVSGKDALTGVLFLNLNDYATTTSGDFLSERLLQPIHSRNLVIRETHTFSGTSVNQLTAAFNRFASATRLKAPNIMGVSDAQAGFTGVHPQDPGFRELPGGGVVEMPMPQALYPGTGSEGRKTTLAVKDDYIRTLGKHTIKAGGSVRLSKLYGVDTWFENGNFDFSKYNTVGSGNANADFLLGLPYTYWQSTGVFEGSRQHSYSGYGTVDWRVRPDLTLNLGIRYELNLPFTDAMNRVIVFRPGSHSLKFPSAPDGVLYAGDPDPILGRVPAGGYPADLRDLAPRIGLAYSPRPRGGLLGRLLGNGHSALRAGFGTYFAPTYGADFSQFSGMFSDLVQLVVGNNGSFANPFGSRPNPFPMAAEQAPLGPQSWIHVFDPRFRTARTYEYSLSVQRELPQSLMLEFSYIGSTSVRLDREVDENPATMTSTGDLLFRYPQLASILVQKSDGRSRYDSFQARVTRRFKPGLMLDISYVLSKSLDDSSGPVYTNHAFLYAPANDRAGESDPYTWARSEFDRRHNFVAFFSYDLPSVHRNGPLKLLLNRWQIGAITQLRSGMPIDIVSSSINARPNIVGQFERFDPRQVRTFVVGGKEVTGNYLFNPTAFRSPNGFNEWVGPPGNLGRNVFDGPGLNLTSVSVVKRSMIGESQQVELRADVSNVFNHVNFDPNTLGGSLDYPSFGLVQGALPGRSIQLSLRYKF
jgi:hypothetical protein